VSRRTVSRLEPGPLIVTFVERSGSAQHSLVCERIGVLLAAGDVEACDGLEVNRNRRREILSHAASGDGW
jgi:hypothetical protein